MAIFGAVKIRGDEVWIPADAPMNSYNDFRECRKSYRKTHGKILDCIQYYELLEATTTLELMLWKMKICDTNAGSTGERQECRPSILSLGPVKDAILQYHSYEY